MSLDLKIIAAVAENRVIGRYGGIPWDLPGDLIRFQRLTSGKPVIMGRRTFDSIHKRLRRPLPNRDNIVLTRNREFDSAGIFLVYSFEEALNIASDLNDEACVIGGSTLYGLALESPLTRSMAITEVHKEFYGDAFFPEFGDEWEETHREYLAYVNREGEEIRYSFVDYKG
ncbi:dihydrofolate reductase [Candidatus Woesearchaeota archaeon]|nr:dihydrofolate reductase [Candidatus Woesearchaeota archaeon]